MNDSYVESLLYSLRTDESLEFGVPPPLEHETDKLRLRLDEGVLTVWPKVNFASAEAAKDVVDAYLRAWEIHEATRNGQRRLRFEFESANITDRDPPPEGPRTAEYVVSRFDTLRSVRRKPERLGSYPAPPQTFTASPDVETMWQRYEGYLEGREPLLSMAYFCLTVLEHAARNAPGKSKLKKVRNAYGVDEKVLRELSRLSSTAGNRISARKVDAQSQGVPLTRQEEDWVKRCVAVLIRRAGEVAADPQAATSPITMTTLSSL